MHSTFNALLYTNSVPSSRERHQIRDLLDESRVELDKLTQEITQLQSLLDAASRKRNEQEQYMDAHAALLSPARRLPDDIVRVIFLASLPETRNSALVPQESPLLVSQICSAWRNIALSTPRLWSAIHIAVPGQAKLDRLTHQVSLWLTRSGAAPLSISLWLSSTAFSSDGPCDITSLSDLLVRESRRWYHISVSLPQATANSLFATLSPGDTPLLRTIIFRNGPRRRYMRTAGLSESNTPFSFLGTTSLRSLTISSSSAAVQSHISWATLRHLSVERGGLENPLGLTHAVALTILAQCHRLESCELSLVRKALNTTTDPIPIPHVTLPHLTSLTLIIHIQAIGDHTRFFHHATLPALRTLHCQGGHDNGSNLRPSFLPDDLSNLESLTLDVQAFPRDIVLEALSEMHSLRQLRILKEPFVPQLQPILHIGDLILQPTPPPPEWLTYLHVHISDPESSPSLPVVCPRLRHLELTLYRAMSDAEIVQLIRSRHRSPGVASLEYFACTSNVMKPQGGVDIAAQLKEQVEDGLKLTLDWKGRTRVRAQMAYSALDGL